MSADLDLLVSLTIVDNESHQSINQSNNQSNVTKNDDELTWLPIYIAAAFGAILNVAYFSHLLYDSFLPSHAAPVNRFHTMSYGTSSLCNHTDSNSSLTNSNEMLPLNASRWLEYDQLKNEWCHYPEYETSIDWKDDDYQNNYLTSSHPESSCSAIYSLPFNISVSNTGYLTVNNCTDGMFNYSTSHHTSPANRNQSIDGIQLQWPATFVYVWCDAHPDPAFVTFHVPQKDNKLIKQSNRPNVLFLQIDALSYKRLPVVMPKTYQLMERLATKSVLSDVEAWKFNKFSVRGHGSTSAFESIFGHTRGRRDSDSRAWLWRQAKENGYVTAFGETSCQSEKFEHSRSGIDVLSQEAGKYMDYNFMSPFCGDNEADYIRQEDTQHCTRGKINFKHMYDPLIQAMDHYQSIRQPVFFSGNLLEANVENGFPARHADDTNYADYLEHLVNTPNTVVVFFSDHGLNSGEYYSNTPAGIQDHRHPFLYITSTVKNLRVDHANLNRLITPFDLWLTITHLISGADYTSPANLEEMDFRVVAIESTVDLFNTVIQPTRTCHHTKLARHECSDKLNSLADEIDYCLCQSPFSIMCPRPRSIVPDVWQECTQTWTQPKDFDVRFYANKQSIDDPCEAVTHWCTMGMHRRYQAKP